MVQTKSTSEADFSRTRLISLKQDRFCTSKAENFLSFKRTFIAGVIQLIFYLTANFSTKYQTTSAFNSVVLAESKMCALSIDSIENDNEIK